jgi:uncharacterized membrane-anchored protein YhcB (DUF1043 family)
MGEMNWEEIGYWVGFTVAFTLGVIVAILIVRWAKKRAQKSGK